MATRAWSRLSVKSINEDERIIEGVATTPSTDRMDDIVEPLGAVFELPLPFLMQHDSGSPVGHVIAAQPTKDGIPVTIKLQKTDEPGGVKQRLDDAWQDIKLGLVRGLSIGFNAIEYAQIAGTYGYRYTKWEWLELSGVTIPANQEATISTIKSYDAGAPSSTNGNPPRVRGAVKLVKTTPKAKGQMTIKEQITQFENTRAAKAAERDELMNKAAEKGETLDAEQADKYDELDGEIKSIDAHLVRLRKQEAEVIERAVPVNGTSTEAASASRGTTPVVVVHEEKLEPGIEFARFAMCLAGAKGNVRDAIALAEHHYPKQTRGLSVLKAAAQRGVQPHKLIENMVQAKGAVDAGTTTDSTWAAPLVAYNQFAGDFVEFLRPRTLIGRLTGLRSIPFNVHIRAQTSGGSANWTGQGKGKSVTKFDFNDAYHQFTKVAAISVITDELVRFSNPSAERLVRDGLAGAVIERIDTDFIDPDVYYIEGVRPASITRGVTAIESSGDDLDAVLTDLKAVCYACMIGNLDMTNAVYMTTPVIAMALGLLRTDLGQPAFPDINMMGGSLLGVPVITSNYVPAGTFVMAVQDEIYLSDDGTVTLDASREASIEMDSAPTGDASNGTGASLVSMFQTNSIALRAERFINWSKRRNTAVAYLKHVSWGGLTIES